MIVSLRVLQRRFGFVKNALEYIPESVSSMKTICFKTILVSLNLTYSLSSPLKPVYAYTALFKEKEF